MRNWKSMTPRQLTRMQSAKLNARIENGSIIAPDGVDVSHRLELRERKTIAQVRYVKSRNVMGLFAEEQGGFVYSMFNSTQSILDRFVTLTQSDVARLMFIGTYTGYNKGRLFFDNGVPITRKSLESITKMSRARFSEFFGRMVDADILREESDGAIYMNPTVFQRGEVAGGTEDYSRIRIYRKTVRSLYEKYGGGRNVKQLAIVFMVIPFLHYNSNIVCYNPTEKYVEEVQPMTLDKLAVLLDYKQTSKLKTAMANVKLNDQPVFAFVEDIHDNRKRRIIVNPRVIFAGNAEGLAYVRALSALFN